MFLERIIDILLQRRNKEHQNNPQDYFKDHSQLKEQSIWHSDATGMPEGIYNLIYEIPNLGKTLFGTGYYFSIISIAENQTIVTELYRIRKNDYDSLIESQIKFQKPIYSITPNDIAQAYPKIHEVINAEPEYHPFHHKPALRRMKDLE